MMRETLQGLEDLLEGVVQGVCRLIQLISGPLCIPVVNTGYICGRKVANGEVGSKCCAVGEE